MIDLRLTVRPHGGEAYVWRLNVNGVLLQFVTRAKRRPVAVRRHN